MRGTIVCILLLVAGTASAQESSVTVDVSPRETYVGVPVTLTITIENTDKYVLPDIEIDGARIQAQPGRSERTYTQIINGRTTTTSSFVHQYRIVPTQTGVLTLPALGVRIDGEITRTAPIEIIVKDIDNDEEDLEKVILEIESQRTTFYLGEPVEATLRIWIKPYRDAEYSVTVDRDNMWRLINEDLSTWGEFSDALEQLRNSPFRGLRNDAAPPEGGETLRDTADGDRRAYYFYELRATIWPKQAGELGLDDLQVLMEYPTRLGRRRGVFSDSLVITDSQLIRATLERSRITIKPTPEEGKPAAFAGAVGRYGIEVQAQPTEVTVGDPITIAIDIRDRTGESRLDVLQPPPLEATPELAEHFRIPTDPLAGEVVGDTKRFVQTIRAESEDVTRIPPIQFAYFDPVREQYVTVESKPIPLTVRPGASLSMTDIVESPGGPPPGRTGPMQLTTIEGGVLANYTGADALLSSQALTIGWAQVTTLLAPPFLVGVVALARRRVRRLRTDERYARRRGAKRNALRALAHADTADPGARMDAIADALSGYIADRCHLPAGAHTRRELTGRLRSGGIDNRLISDVDALLAECEQGRYAGVTTEIADDAAHSVRALIDRLEREGLS